MSTERYAFPTLIESLQKGFGERLTPAVLAQWKALGVDVKKLPPAIPADVMAECLRVLARELFPHLSLEEGLRQVGVSFILGWQQTLLGAAASAMLRLIGPVRSLGRLERAFRTADNYSSAVATIQGANDAVIDVADVAELPTYWRGLFEAALHVMGLKGRVELALYEPPRARYLLHWD